VRRDEALFHAGDTADAGYVVQSGAIRVSSEDAGGYRDVVANPGTLIGELALVVEMQRPSTAVAIAESSVLRISRSMFQRVLEGHPDAARRLRIGGANCVYGLRPRGIARHGRLEQPRTLRHYCLPHSNLANHADRFFAIGSRHVEVRQQAHQRRPDRVD